MTYSFDQFIPSGACESVANCEVHCSPAAQRPLAILAVQEACDD